MTTVTTSRKIAASPPAVFAAFQDPVQLATWWGPRGFTNTFDTFESSPRDGGFLPCTAQTACRTHIRRCLPPSRSTAKWCQHQCQPFFELAITRTADGDGTLVLWEQAFADPAVAEAVRTIGEPANEDSLDRLTEVVCG